MADGAKIGDSLREASLALKVQNLPIVLGPRLPASCLLMALRRVMARIEDAVY